MSDQPKTNWRKPLPARVGIGCCLFIVLGILCFAIAFSDDAVQSRAPAYAVSARIIAGIVIGILALIATILFVAVVVSDQTRARLFNRRSAGRCVFGLACLATLVALFYAVENWRGKRAWKAYVQEQTAKGEKLDPAAFVPPPVPDNQNLCLAPLLKPSMDFSLKPYVRHDTNGLARLERIYPEWSVEAYRGALPAGEKKEAVYQAGTFLNHNGLTNGWINLSAWQAYYRTGTNLSGIAPTNTAAADVLLALRYLDVDLAQLKRDAAERPLARWPVQYDFSDPWAILLPHLSHGKRLANLLQLRSAAFLAAGDPQSAASDLDLAFRLADSSGQEPILISQLVRMACLNISLQPVKEGLARRQFSDAQLATLEKRLGQVDLLSGYELSMRAERAFHSGWFAKPRPWNEMVSFYGDPDRTQVSAKLDLLLRFAPSGWVYRNQLVLCKWQDDHTIPLVDAVKRRAYPQLAAEAKRAFSELKGCSTLLTRLWYSERQENDLDNSARKMAYTQAQLDQARIACALERHRFAYGAYPETLNALVPQFIAALPHDLIGGQPLKYRGTDDGRFLLYSVGWNETDNGGAEVLKKTGQPDTEKGDWVWQVPVP